MNLPTVLAGNVSSYRIFPFYNYSKSGLGSDGNLATNQLLNTTGCYDWGTGNSSTLPDVEWVCNHIYEDWPSSSACGSCTHTPHLKTNNEPRNSSDDHPQDLETILNNWQNLMRTGMRLCSPTSWDGSDWWNGEGFIYDQFLPAIDARGWRCDIVDAHCYWNEANFGYLEQYWWGNSGSQHKRPIWVSEWIWGASWNSNGCFASGQTESTIVSTTSKILNTLDNSAHVERYFYWNSEADISKVAKYTNGVASLTTLGQTYATKGNVLGYNADYQFIPTVVLNRPYGLSGTIDGSNVSLSWYSPNGDMAGDVKIQYKLASASNWTTLATQHAADKTSKNDASNTFSGTLNNAGNYVWRVVETYESTDYASDVFATTVEQNDNLTYIPSNLGDYYFQFYSKEANNLSWAVAASGENRVLYKTSDSTDPYQLWCIENNASNGGYSFRNLGEPGYLICSPNSWNFITRNNNYTVAAAQTAFLPEYYSSGDYWGVKNVTHNAYVGLYTAETDRTFSNGATLAGNRTNPATANVDDRADRIGIRAIPRATVNSALGITAGETATSGTSYYIYNADAGKFLVNGNSYGTRASLGDSGLLWTLEQDSSTSLYAIKNSTYDNPYLYVAGEDGMWVDGASSVGYSASGSTSYTDVTNTYITNADLSSATGWTITNKEAGPTNNAIEFYAGWGSLSVTSFSILQSITLPAGSYKLVGHGFFRYGNTYDVDPTKSLAYLKAGGSTTLLPTLGSVSLSSYANNFSEAQTVLAGDTYETTLEFTLSSSSTIEIGVTGTFDLKQSWCPVGAFKLYQGNGTGAPSNEGNQRFFQLTKGSDDFYTMQVNPNSTEYGTSVMGTRYVGFVGDLAGTPYVLPLPKETYHSGVGSKWLFMSETAYMLYKEAINGASSYRADMWPYVWSALQKGIGSEEIAIYRNPESTVADIMNAQKSLKTKLLALEATEQSPVDYSFLLGNAGCGSTTFEGWNADGDWSSNTTFYHNGDALLTNRFYEIWVAGGSTLGDRTLSQTPTNLPAGKYQLALDIIATQQGDASVTVTGVNLFIGDQKVACATANGVPQCFTTPTFTIGAEGTTTMGLEIVGTTGNWVAFDNFRLFYLGGAVEAGNVDDADGVNTTDVEKLVAYILGKPNHGVTNLDAANVDGAGGIDIADVTKLINIILGR